MRSQAHTLHRACRGALALVACLGVLLAAALSPGALRPESVELAAVQLEPSAQPADLVLTSTASIDQSGMAPAERVPIASASVAPVSSQKPRPQSRRRNLRAEVGRVNVRAVDTRTGAPLDRLRVRALSSMRIADRESPSGACELALKLSPGSYSLIVMVPGYEPAELPPVRVGAKTTIHVTDAALRRGTARISGTVRGAPRDASTLHVEIMGIGRRPCGSCGGGEAAAGADEAPGSRAWSRSEPCARCGFTARSTRVPVEPSGRFALAELASGAYSVRVVDGRTLVSEVPVAVELVEAGSAHLELEAPRPRSVLVEVVDLDGASLAGTWAHRSGWARPERREGHDDVEIRPTSQPVVEDLPWSCGFSAAEVGIATGGFSTPLAFGFRAFHSWSRGCGRSVTGPHDDRPRKSGEELRPPADAPRFVPRVLDPRVGAEGFAEFHGLPASALTLEMTCSHYTATVSVPATHETVRVRAHLVRADGERAVNSRTFSDFESLRYR